MFWTVLLGGPFFGWILGLCRDPVLTPCFNPGLCGIVVLRVKQQCQGQSYVQCTRQAYGQGTGLTTLGRGGGLQH